MTPSDPGSSPLGPAPGWRRAKSWIALGILLAAALGSLAPFLGYLTDDAFVHFQFAKHLVQGSGFTFNAGEPTGGSTSPLWVLLLALAGKALRLSVAAPGDARSMPAIAWVAKALGAFCHVISIWLIVRLGKRLGWDDWTSLAAGALLAAHAWVVRWSLSGTESALVLAVTVASLYLLAGVLLDAKPAWLAGAALAMVALSRPEGSLYAALALVALCAGAARRVRRALELIVGASVVLLVWMPHAARWHQPLIPNVAARIAGVWAKPGLAIGSIHSAIQTELATDALPLAFFALLLAFGSRSTALPEAAGRRSLWLFLAAWPPLLVLSFAATGTQVVSRYLIPAVPCVLLLGIASLRWVAATTFAGRTPLVLAGFVAAFALQNGILTAWVAAPHAHSHVQGLRASLVSLGIWARDRTPPGAYFAAADIGAFGYYSERRVLDLRGATTPSLEPILVREGYDAVVKRVLYEGEGRPDYLIDRHPSRGRLARDDSEMNPYRVVVAREFAGLSTASPSAYFYTVYSIDWSVVDRTREHIAERGGGLGAAARATSAGDGDARFAHARAGLY